MKRFLSFLAALVLVATSWRSLTLSGAASRVHGESNDGPKWSSIWAMPPGPPARWNVSIGPWNAQRRPGLSVIDASFCSTVASPLARQYYFMWLFFPMTVLIHRAAYDPRPAVRGWTWASLAVAGLLMGLSLPVFPNDLQAYGNNLAATIVLEIASLRWTSWPLPVTTSTPASSP